VTWIAPDVERSEDYPARRNEPEREMLRDWLDWHRATLLRKCAGLDADGWLSGPCRRRISPCSAWSGT
jgi:hypothetical protein